jgi:hypothetical protein
MLERVESEWQIEAYMRQVDLLFETVVALGGASMRRRRKPTRLEANWPLLRRAIALK